MNDFLSNELEITRLLDFIVSIDPLILDDCQRYDHVVDMLYKLVYGDDYYE